MSLQFSDVLIYGSRLSPPKLQFKVHGQLALCSVDVSRLSVVYILIVFSSDIIPPILHSVSSEQ